MENKPKKFLPTVRKHMKRILMMKGNKLEENDIQVCFNIFTLLAASKAK